MNSSGLPSGNQTWQWNIHDYTIYRWIFHPAPPRSRVDFQNSGYLGFQVASWISLVSLVSANREPLLEGFGSYMANRLMALEGAQGFRMSSADGLIAPTDAQIQDATLNGHQTRETQL